jgi:hypothetical protein
MNTQSFIRLPLTHAQIRNARFNTDTSKFVSAKQRFADYCAFVPGSVNQMQNAIKEFKKAFPDLTWEKISSNLVGAQTCKLTDIRIDDTMNRPLNWEHVIKILKKFCATRVMAVNVYKDPLAPGCYIAWDGQHTTIVLYILAVMVFEQPIGAIEIPINISKATSKEEIRTNFIEINGEAKLDLSPLDLFEQKVYGALLDNSTIEDWAIAAKKFHALEKVDLFLTSSAYRDEHESGAITHVSSIIKNDLDIVEKFATYWKFRSAFENRKVETKEIIHMIYLFVYAKSEKVDWSEKDIADIVDIFWNCFSCEFTPSPYLNVFWKKLHTSYETWYNIVYKNVDEEYRPKQLKMTTGTGGDHQETFGLKFMLSQLKHSGFKGKLPEYEHPAGYKPKKTDLWSYSIVDSVQIPVMG